MLDIAGRATSQRPSRVFQFTRRACNLGIRHDAEFSFRLGSHPDCIPDHQLTFCSSSKSDPSPPQPYEKAPFVSMMLFSRTTNRAFIKSLIVAAGVIAVASFIAVSVKDSTHAADPSPVNPPGSIPVILTNSEGRIFEVFTPEQGGSIVGDDYSFVAVPGDVPSAVIVGIQMTRGGAASNAGFTHHRYTLGGAFYTIDAVDEDGKTPSPRFAFRNPPAACVPIPGDFLSNINSVRLIVTDLDGSTQTVLNSGARVEGGNLKICGYVGSVPATVAVALEGSPGPVPPSPAAAVQVVELPVTGGVSPNHFAVILMLMIGSTLTAGGLIRLARGADNGEPRQVRKSDNSSRIASSSSPS